MSDVTIRYHLFQETHDGCFHRFIIVLTLNNDEGFQVLGTELQSLKAGKPPLRGALYRGQVNCSTLEEAESQAKAMRDQQVEAGWSDVTPQRS
jgi:hypothetical protein